MKKLTITQGERRFLILWVATWCIALFVNMAGIKGEILSKSYPQYLFTEGSIKHTYNHKDDFYPFTTFIQFAKSRTIPEGASYTVPYRRFNGLFNSFDVTEWVVFCLIGIGIVFVPKVW